MSVRTLRRLACQADVVLMVEDDTGRPLDVGRTQRHATAKQRRALRLRDPGCRFPGCTANRHLHVHHALEWDANNGPTDMDNLLHLCGFHHRFLHRADWHARPDGNGRFTFLDATGTPFTARPDVFARSTIEQHETTPEGDSAESAAGQDPDLQRDSAESPRSPRSAETAVRTLQPRHWHGEPVDLDLCIAVLRQELARRGERDAPSSIAA